MGTPYLGEIRVMSFNFAPKGWAVCSGQLLPINQNQALFALLGTQFGGNGVTTFALPDLRGRVGVGQGQGLGLSNYVVGENGGEAAHTLISQEMAPHGHTFAAGSATATTNDPTQGTFTLAAVSLRMGNLYSPAAGAVARNDTLTFSGGNQPHENRQPLLALTVVIALQGIFPSRNLIIGSGGPHV